MNLADSSDLACCIMQRLVSVMSHLATISSATSLGSLVLMEPKVPKYNKVQEWARQAGHSLNAHKKCVKCHLQLNMSRNLAFLKQILTLKCLGGPDSLPQVILHTKPMEDGADSFQHYVYHGLSVQKSHTMATSGMLKLHFCSYCGAYGRARAYHLQEPCPLVPSKAGKQALNAIANDKDPGYRKEKPRGPKAHLEAGISRKYSLG